MNLHNMLPKFSQIICALLISSVSLITFADEAENLPNYKDEALTGDWNGNRTDLYKKGIEFGIVHKSDVLLNTSGGIKRGTAWEGHTELGLSLDFEKMLGWNSTTAYVLYHSQLGSKFNNYYVGSNSGVDNIEVTTNTAQFYQAWLQKNFYNNQLSLLAGLYAVDSEFQISDTSGLFINPVYGVNNEYAQSGQAGPAVFPLGALGLRAKYTSPAKNFYAMGAITDGVPGDPNNGHGTHIKLGRGDGTFSIVEFGYTPQLEGLAEGAEYYSKVAFGFWGYSAKVADLDPAVTYKHYSQGIYLLGEQSLYVEQGHPAQGLAGFVRIGFAPEKTQQVDWMGSVGLRYHGIFDGRDDDIAGVALTTNHASNLYRNLNGSDHYETELEVTYRAQIKPWLALQPDVQYIINPNMDLNLKDAWVFGLRTEVNF
jgi:porin